MARRYAKGVLLDTVPVAWARDFNFNKGLLKVHFKRADELQDYNSRRAPFAVAIAKAKDWNVLPHTIEFFTCVFLVEATGEILSERAIQTRVLERLRS